MNRRLFLSRALLALAAPLTAEAQHPQRVYRLGVIWSPSGGGQLETLRHSLQELGYVEGQNLAIEQRFTEELTLDEAVVIELIQRRVDVILTSGSTATRAVKNATSTIPVVMTLVSDPIGQGFAQTLRRPGRNITGLSTLGSELVPKALELLRETVPKASRVSVVFYSDLRIHRILVKELEDAAKASGVEILHAVTANSEANIGASLATVKKQRPNGLIVLVPASTTNRKSIVDFAAAERLPAVYWWREFVEAGGLMHYGPSLDEMYRRAASYVDKIFRGQNPADLPIEQPTKVELVINLRAAKALGLTIPPSVLLRADQVIE